MFHLFIKVINIEIGTKLFIQPDTNSSVFSPVADEQSEAQGVSCGLEGLLGEAAGAARRWERHAGVRWHAMVVI